MPWIDYPYSLESTSCLFLSLPYSSFLFISLLHVLFPPIIIPLSLFIDLFSPPSFYLPSPTKSTTALHLQPPAEVKHCPIHSTGKEYTNRILNQPTLHPLPGPKIPSSNSFSTKVLLSTSSQITLPISHPFVPLIFLERMRCGLGCCLCKSNVRSDLKPRSLRVTNFFAKMKTFPDSVWSHAAQQIQTPIQRAWNGAT